MRKPPFVIRHNTTQKIISIISISLNRKRLFYSGPRGFVSTSEEPSKHNCFYSLSSNHLLNCTVSYKYSCNVIRNKTFFDELINSLLVLLPLRLLEGYHY